MGVLVAGVNVMGVWWAGVDGMGLKRLGPMPAALQHHHQGHGAAPVGNLYPYPSKVVAVQKARELGCDGVHALGALWMPCAEYPKP